MRSCGEETVSVWSPSMVSHQEYSCVKYSGTHDFDYGYWKYSRIFHFIMVWTSPCSLKYSGIHHVFMVLEVFRDTCCHHGFRSLPLCYEISLNKKHRTRLIVFTFTIVFRFITISRSGLLALRIFHLFQE